MGVTTLPLDFDIFFRSGSRIQPESAARLHGIPPCAKCERTIVENNQVRMMSCPCGRMSMGNTRRNKSSPSAQCVAICGVSDDVAQVSMTSGSPTNPPTTPRCCAVKPSGTSVLGSIGSFDVSGTIGEE